MLKLKTIAFFLLVYAGNVFAQKTTPTITWPTPAAITYGTALSATQLNAKAPIQSNGLVMQGTFVYTPATGVVLDVGVQTLSVVFTPRDTTDYSTATATVTLTVSPSGTPNIIPVFTGGPTLGNSSIAQRGGNVGIGTTSPAYALDVETGVINSSGGFCIGGACITSWNAQATQSNDGTYLGYKAGALTTGTSSGNTFIGWVAGASNTAGLHNVAVGYSALEKNTTGGGNTAVGTQAFFGNTTGAESTAVGNAALFSNTTGSYNTVTGSQALHGNTTGANNVAVGYGAGAVASGNAPNSASNNSIYISVTTL